MKVAINIPTADWNRIIEGLLTEGWKMTMKYDGFDAGIDFDFLILEKDKESIIFGWDNWLEGEIKCTSNRMNILTAQFDVAFTIGTPTNLKSSVITLTKLQIMQNRLRKWM